MRPRWPSAVLALALGAVVFALASRPEPAAPEATPVRFVALTSAPTNEGDPSPSPDGTRLAFSIAAAAGQRRPVRHLHLRRPRRHAGAVTTHPADDRLPAWSPDAQSLAFARIDGRTCDVMLLSLADRRERRLASAATSKSRTSRGRPNGEWLVESFAPGPDPIRGWQIARVSTATGVREALTLPTPGTLGDHSPSVSPDGTRIAFVRGINGATADIHLMPFNGGTPTRLTWDNQDIIGIDWMPDGRSMVFASDRAGGYSIFRVPGRRRRSAVGRRRIGEVEAPGGRARQRPDRLRELGVRDQPVGIARSRRPVTNLKAIRSPRCGPSCRRRICGTTRRICRPTERSSPSCRRDRVSRKSGSRDRDGSSPRQLSRFTRAALRQPRWSPDGKRILISASVQRSAGSLRDRCRDRRNDATHRRCGR